MSRARRNMRRIQMALVGVRRFKRRFDDIKVGRVSTAVLAKGCLQLAATPGASSGQHQAAKPALLHCAPPSHFPSTITALATPILHSHADVEGA